MMIVVIEVARGEGDLVVAAHLAQERLLPLHLHLLRVRAEIDACESEREIFVRLIYSCTTGRGTHR